VALPIYNGRGDPIPMECGSCRGTKFLKHDTGEKDF